MTERLISADDHVDLSHEAIKAHLASNLHDDYDQALMKFGASMAPMVSNAANQRWRDQQGMEPDTSGQSMMSGDRNHPAWGRAGHTDPHERLKDMDTDGVEASSTYCEVSAFRYLYLLERGGPQATRAFNTALAEWASVAPDRLLVSSQIPIHDIDSAVKEVEWVAANGGKSLQLPVFPNELGMPDYWDGRYDPLWSVISETGLPICCHIGLNTSLEGLAERDPTPQKGIFVPLVALTAAEALGMFIMGGVFERFPKLKVVYVEPGLGWVSWWLYIVDDLMERQGYDFPAITQLPSHYFRQNVFLTFIDEPEALQHARNRLGVENIMWSSDYPHPVSSWPQSRKMADEMMAEATPYERERILHANAAQVWGI